MLKQDAVREVVRTYTPLLWMLSKWISGWEDGIATSAMPWGVAAGSDSKIEMQLWVRTGCLSACVKRMLKDKT